MGNEQSKKNSNVQIELNHSRINLLKVINDSKKRYMQTVFAVDKHNYDLWKNQLEKAKMNTTHLLIPFQHSFESKQFCGSSGSVKVNYQNYPYLLLDQIQNRRAKKKRFDQTQLWLLLYCLLDAQKQIKLGNLSRIGDVQPQNIFFNEQGQMKVANILSWPKQTSNYQKFLQNQATYLAPEDIQLIQATNIDNSQNTQSQIFSIGLTILSAANLVDYKFLYNTTARKFDINQFNAIVNQWKLNDYYSDIFKATLCSLIQVDRQIRITQDVLFGWIQNYREFIISRTNFTINNPPQLIINQVQNMRKLYESLSSNYSIQNPTGINPSLGAQFKQIGVPLQGSRRLVEQIRHPPITVIPGNQLPQSVYKPIDQPSYMSNFLLQGAPITTPPVYVNRTTVPLIENQTLAESVYYRNWSSQGGNNVIKTNFEYSSSPDRKVEQVQQNTNKPSQQQSNSKQNQPQIHQDKTPQHENPAQQ